MDNFKEMSNEVRRVWEEDNKAVEDLGAEEESQQETLEGRCCELEYNKVTELKERSDIIMFWQLSDRLLDIDNKISALADTLHLMLPSQKDMKEINGRYRSDLYSYCDQAGFINIWESK